MVVLCLAGCDWIGHGVGSVLCSSWLPPARPLLEPLLSLAVCVSAFPACSADRYCKTASVFGMAGIICCCECNDVYVGMLLLSETCFVYTVSVAYLMHTRIRFA